MGFILHHITSLVINILPREHKIPTVWIYNNPKFINLLCFVYIVTSCDSTTQFPCSDTGQCIPVQLRCNNVSDCLDGSDEFECGGKYLLMWNS